MKNHALHLNTRRCIGCHGCEVHCKVNKNLPVGVLLCHITVGQLKKAGNVPQAEISFSHCYHCEQPLCVAACPVDAMIQRKDGIVFIDQEKCIGCMACTYSGEKSADRQSDKVRSLLRPYRCRAASCLCYQMYYSCVAACSF